MTDLPTDTGAPAAAETAAPAPVETLETVLTRQMGDTYDRIEARDRMPEKGTDGRFVSDKPAEAPIAATPAETTVEPAPKEGEQAPPASAPPDAWTAEAKAKWAALPPDVQAYVASREKQVNDALSQKGQELSRFEPIARALEPHRARMQSVGVAEPEFVSRLLNAEAALYNPQTRGQAFKWLADQYGFDLAALSGSSPAGGAQAPASTDPAVAALHQQIAGLTRWANGIAEADRRAHSERAEAANREAQAKADAYLADPKFPHAKELQDEIADHILIARQRHQTLSFEDAYARATRANPAIWAKLEAERIASEKQKADEAAAKAAKEARTRAPTTVKPRGSTAGPAPAKGDWEARMRANYDRLNGAA